MSVGRCIPDLLASGELPAERAEEILELYGELERVHRRQFGEQGAAQMASAATLTQLRVAAAEKRRVQLKGVQARATLLSNMKGYDGADPMGGGPINPKAAIAVFAEDGRARYSALDRRRQAIRGIAQGMIDGLLAKHRRNLLGNVREPAELADLVRELFAPGSTKNANAAELAGAWTRAAEYLRGLYNEAGGHIGKLDRWGLPQAHDSRAIGKAGFKAWRDWFGPNFERLDRSRMIDNRTGAPFSDEALELVMRDVFETIRTDGWSKITPGAPTGKMLANRNAEHRFLHFKDADAWLDYAGQYGAGTPFDAMMGHVDAMSRDVAALQLLGPNPDATVAWLQDSIIKSAKLTDDVAAAERAEAIAPKVGRLWAEYTGALRRPESRKLALGFGTARAVQTAAKLGSAFLSSITDTATGAVTRAYNGLPVMPMVKSYLAHFAPGTIEGRRQAVRAGLIAEEWSNMAATSHRLLGEELTGEVARRLASGVLRVSGLARWTEAGRWAFGMEFLGFLTDHVGMKFAALPEPLQRTLERAGIGADGWELIRKTPLEADRGADWLYPRNVADQELGFKLLEMVQTEADHAVPVPDIRTRTIMHSIAPAGTWFGEVLRSVLLFKSFGITIMLQQSRRIMEMQPGSRLGYAIGFFAATTLAGALVLQLRELAKGRDPRDMTGGGDAAKASQFWGAAMLQGGGWGIFGDFLGSAENRFGGGFAETLAGPMVQTAQNVADLTVGNLLKALRGDETDVGRDLVRLIKQETPGQSIWYSRLLFERLVADQLQRAIDPNFGDYQRRVERRAAEQGSAFYWPTGEAAPQRAPDLDAAFGGVDQ